MQPYDKSFEQAQEVRIVDSTVKRRFNVVLDSNVGASFSGPQFNATFTVDLKTIVRESWRLKKSYYMTFQFISAAALLATNSISTAVTYTLHIDLGKGQNIYRYNNIKPPSGIIRVSSNPIVTPATDPTFFFDSKPTDNSAVFIDNLLDIVNININLLDNINNTTFNSSNNSSINTATKYVCILTFEEA